MKKSFVSMVCIATLTVLSSSAFAKDPRQPVTVSKDPSGYIRVILTGDAAKKMFELLDAPVEVQFGRVQTSTKNMQNIECVRAILGDIPGQMSEKRYTCTLFEENAQ